MVANSPRKHDRECAGMERGTSNNTFGITATNYGDYAHSRVQGRPANALRHTQHQNLKIFYEPNSTVNKTVA